MPSVNLLFDFFLTEYLICIENNPKFQVKSLDRYQEISSLKSRLANFHCDFLIFCKNMT